MGRCLGSFRVLPAILVVLPQPCVIVVAVKHVETGEIHTVELVSRLLRHFAHFLELVRVGEVILRLRQNGVDVGEALDRHVDLLRQVVDGFRILSIEI